MTPTHTSACQQTRLVQVLVIGGVLFSALPVSAQTKTRPASGGTNNPASAKTLTQPSSGPSGPGGYTIPATPIDVTTLSPEAFDQLDGGALLRVGRKSFSKNALVRRFIEHETRTSQAKPSLEHPPGDDDAGRKAAVEASNQQVLAEQARVNSAPDAATASSKAAFNPQPDPPGVGAKSSAVSGASEKPVIERVVGTASDGALILVEGHNLSNGPGYVTLEGNFPHPPGLKIQGWNSKAVLAQVTLPKGAAQDQTARLELHTSDERKAVTSIPFKAALVGANLRDEDVRVSLAPGAVLGGCHADREGVFSVNRLLLPTGKTMTGCDTFTLVPLARGWALQSTGFSTNKTPGGVTIQGGLPVVVKWTYTPPACKDELSDGLIEHCRLRYDIYFHVAGPKGLWYK